MKRIPPIRLAWYALGFLLALFALLGSCGCAGTGWSDLPRPIETDPTEEPVHQPAGTKRVNVRWTAPCLGDTLPCGGPWTHYVLETRAARGDWIFRLATEDTTAQLILTPGTWLARVAAVNDSIQGPYSEPSEPITIKRPVDDDLPDIHREESQ